MNAGKKRLAGNLAVIILPLVIGVGIYFLGRKSSTRYEQWLTVKKEGSAWHIANWAPDFLWCVSLLACVSLIWNGWDKVPKNWKLALWAGISGTEWLQYKHWIPGTGDWWDVVAYQIAFVFIYFLHKKHML